MAKRSSSSKSTKSNSNNNVKFIRLVTGEDIVTQVNEIANGKMIIHNPLKVIYTPSMNTGFLSISLMQWIFTRISKNQTFDLDLHNVLVMSDADTSLREHYQESLYTFEEKLKDGEEEQYEDDFDTYDPEEGLDMLKDILDKIKGNKGNLH